eukprot:3686331-Rhodomonas_salina.5
MRALKRTDHANQKNCSAICDRNAVDFDVRRWDGQLGHDVITEIELEPRLYRLTHMLREVWYSLYDTALYIPKSNARNHIFSSFRTNNGFLAPDFALHRRPIVPCICYAMRGTDAVHVTSAAVACGRAHTVAMTAYMSTPRHSVWCLCASYAMSGTEIACVDNGNVWTWGDNKGA